MKFNKQQEETINTIDGNVAVIAAAGSGKCIRGDSYIFTDNGMYQIQDIPKFFNIKNNNLCIGLRSLSLKDNLVITTQSSKFYNMGFSETIKIITSQGFEIEGTPEHPVVVLNQDGNLVFKRLDKINPSDIIVINKNNDIWGKNDLVSEELGYIIGLLLGDGYLASKNGEISFSKADEYLYEKFEKIIHSEFPNYNITIRHSHKNMYCKNSNTLDHRFFNTSLKNELEDKYGLNMGLSGEKKIPQSILCGNKLVVKRCLQGLFDADGTFNVKKNIFEYCTKSPLMAKQVHLLLLNFGIISRLKIRRNSKLNQNYYYIYIGGSNLRIFARKIGFRFSLKKQHNLLKCLTIKTNDNINVLYNQKERFKSIRKKCIGKSYYNGNLGVLYENNTNITIKLSDYTTGRRNPSHIMIDRILNTIDFSDENTEYLKFLSDNFFFDKITNINKSENIVYDFTVPNTHSFIGNGFINHNTTVLTHRIENMIENHDISPSSILAITFSRKAKDNIIARLEELKISNVNIETFHSFALKIISSTYGSNGYKVWTAQWEKEKVVQDICTSLRLCSVDDIPHNEIFSFIALQKINMKYSTDNLIYTSDMPFKNDDMKRIYKMYEEYKDKNSYIEFDDFLNIANEILDENEDVLIRYQNTFQYVLVDEFQDVSLSQALLLRKLNSQNTMIVGDPLQAIYSFRGGDSKFILNFDADYNDVQVINLNTNYRCSKDIVRTANKLALSIPDSKHKNYVESIADKESFKIPELRHFEDDCEEYEWIAKRITELEGEGYKYNDIAILARTNAQLQKLEMILHSENVAFDVVDGKVFTDLPEIKLVISYLRLALHENDNEAFSYLYNKPNRWLNKKFFEEVEHNSVKRNTSLYNAMFTIDRRNWRFKNGIDEIFEVINYIQNKKCSSVSDLVKYLRNRLNIDEFVTKGKQADDGSYVEQIDNLDSFENLCSMYSTIDQLIAYLDDLNREVEIKRDEKVKLLTIHKSKGMEFPVVFIIGCNEELLPHYKNKNVDDERRLFYVAITRAEKELYLSYVDMYNNKIKNISSFIDDIKDTINIIQPIEKDLK